MLIFHLFSNFEPFFSFLGILLTGVKHVPLAADIEMCKGLQVQALLRW